VLGADDGFASEITNKGHGMHRAALLAIIRAYLALKPKLDNKPGQGASDNLHDRRTGKGAATKLSGNDSKPMAARYCAIQAVARGQAEGDLKKFVPQVVKEIAARLPNLAVSKKLSSTLQTGDA